MSGRSAGMFLRVVERPESGPGAGTMWWLETPDSTAPPLPFSSREEAIEAARRRAPEWLELGEIVPAGRSTPRHHRWTTLRRDGGGDYRRSPLGWAGRPPERRSGR